jgi:hypothetical protein
MHRAGPFGACGDRRRIDLGPSVMAVTMAAAMLAAMGAVIVALMGGLI